jgi:hypothetical protein
VWEDPETGAWFDAPEDGTRVDLATCDDAPLVIVVSETVVETDWEAEA